MIRGAVYQIDLGQTRGHEQRGRRLGVVVSPSNLPLSVATVVPTSTHAGHAVFRPELEIEGRATRLRIDQIRSIDVDHIGDLVGVLTRDEMALLDHALARYLGLLPDWTDGTPA